jgi:hypothetical protein
LKIYQNGNGWQPGAVRRPLMFDAKAPNLGAQVPQNGDILNSLFVIGTIAAGILLVWTLGSMAARD